MARFWTGKGDDGTTGLLYGGREPKSSPRFDAVGDVDEAQAAIGVARAGADRGGELDLVLTAIQRDLWVLMAELATSGANRDKLVRDGSLVTDEMVARLESVIDDVAARFDLPAEFVVPGEDPLSSALDVARTVVRRAERSSAAVADAASSVIPYLNRLSSVLWTLARWVEGEPRRARGD